MSEQSKAVQAEGRLRADWFEQLHWPMLLKSVTLAMRPARVVMAYMCLVLISLCLKIPSIWNESAQGLDKSFASKWPKVASDFSASVADFAPLRILNAIGRLFVGLPTAIVEDQKWYDVVVGVIPAMVVWGLFACAISRSAAEDFVGLSRKTWTEHLSFAVRRLRSSFFAKAGPLVLGWTILLIMSCVGLVLRVPFVQIIAALFSILALLFGVLIVIMAVGVILGAPMLVPAVACEGTDAIDANQRVLAYVYGRPLRYLAYLLVLIALLVAVGSFAGMIFERGITLAVDAMVRFSGDEHRGYLTVMAMSGEEPFSGPEASWHLKTTGKIMSFWVDAWRMIVPAFVLSMFHSGGTLLYLLARRVNDGQETTELWTGLTVPETLKRAEREAAGASDASVG